MTDKYEKSAPINLDPHEAWLILEKLGIDKRKPQATLSDLAATSRFIRDGDTVLVTRWKDVDELLRRPSEFSASNAYSIGTDRPLIPHNIDPPEHRFYKRVLQPLFSPSVVASLRPGMVALANETIDKFIHRGEAELTEDFTWPFPSRVFCRYFGIPFEDLGWFFKIAEAQLHPPGLETSSPEEQHRARTESARQLRDYWDRLFEERRSNPAGDVLTRLINIEVDGRRFTPEELYSICYNVPLAAMHTTTITMNAIFAHLAEHPDQQSLLRADPSLIEPTIEELLRWESPAPYNYRRVKNDTEIAGCPVRKGDRVAYLMSANFDPDMIRDPRKLDFTRAPNRHITFGYGDHRCLGIHLAREDLRVGVSVFLDRISDFWLNPDQEITFEVGSIRGPNKVPIMFKAAL